MLGEHARWASIGALVVVSVVGMVVAVAQDIECRLDCPVTDDVTWRAALIGGGTGLSPPATMLAVVVAVGALGSSRGRWGLAGLALTIAACAVMLVAYALDAGTTDAVRGVEGAAARAIALGVLAAILATAATSIRSFVQRRRAASA